MPISHAVPAQALLDFLNGVHDGGDEYRIALYTPDASLGAGTPGYTEAGEVMGDGYEAGGMVLEERVADIADDGSAFLGFGNPTWPVATISARGALVYNASKGGRPVLAVIDFNETVSSTNGPFTITLPPRLIASRYAGPDTTTPQDITR